MTARALIFVAWVAGGVAWAALILLWREAFLVAGITSAVATLVWGYLTEPSGDGTDPDDWQSDEWWRELEDAR